MMRRVLIFLLIPFLTATPVLGNPALKLPELGGSSIRPLAGTSEAQIGRMIINELRRSNLLLEDPELNEYLQNVGSRLVAAMDTDGTRFTFFLVKDDSINAFALPGGYIGVHSGLMLRTRTESELASVLAHEIAHVTQRHISRRFEAAGSMGLKSLGLMLGVIALAAAGADPNNVGGAMMLGQGMLLQEQINFTRAQEYEADRLGVELLANGGFDPHGMVSFFETMQRIQRLQNRNMPEFLSTHPLSLSRVSEAAQRVQAMNDREIMESRAYPLMKARLGVLTSQDPIALRSQQSGDSAEQAVQYALALAQLRKGDARAAIDGFKALLDQDDSITHFHTGLGFALLDAGRSDEALEVFRTASGLFPDNIPVLLGQVHALRLTGQSRQALQQLRDIFNRHEPEPAHIRLMAQTAADAGAMAESHYYMSEYYLRGGDLGMAHEQLHLAVRQAEPGSREFVQYSARLDEVRDALLEWRRANPRRAREEQRRFSGSPAH